MTPGAPNPDFAAEIARAVMALPAARLLGFRIERLAPGEADLILPFRDALSSRGVFQGGMIGALVDFAGGCAAGTLLAPGMLNATLDYSVKLLAPARAEALLALGRVLQAGKTVTVSRADIYALDGDARALCASGFVTMRNFAARE